jgi:hypothetical protein
MCETDGSFSFYFSICVSVSYRPSTASTGKPTSSRRCKFLPASHRTCSSIYLVSGRVRALGAVWKFGENAALSLFISPWNVVSFRLCESVRRLSVVIARALCIPFSNQKRLWSVLTFEVDDYSGTQRSEPKSTLCRKEKSMNKKLEGTLKILNSTAICYSTHPIDKYLSLNSLHGIYWEESRDPPSNFFCRLFSFFSRYTMDMLDAQPFFPAAESFSDLVIVGMGSYSKGLSRLFSAPYV